MKLFQTFIITILLSSCGEPQHELVQEISQLGDKLSTPITSESTEFEELLTICSALRSKERWFSGVYGPSETFQFKFTHKDCDESKNIKINRLSAKLLAKKAPIVFKTSQESFIKEVQTSSDWPHNVLGKFCPEALSNSITSNVYHGGDYIYEFRIQTGVGKYSTVFINKANLNNQIIQTNELMVRVEGNKRQYGLVYYHKKISLCEDGKNMSTTIQKLINVPKE